MRIALLALLSLWLAPAAQALYISYEVEKVPVTRVIENLEKRLHATPGDFELHYQLARVYAMAATTGTPTLKVINAPQNRDRDGVVEFSPPGSDNGLPENRGAGYPAVMPAKDFDSKQLGKAIWHYEVAQAAMKRSSKPDQVHWLVRPTLLGYAWCLDKAGRRSEAIAAYREALAIAWNQEFTRQFKVEDWMKGARYEVKAPPAPNASEREHLDSGICFSEECIGYLLNLLDQQKDREEIQLLKACRTRLQRTRRAVTPILIPLGDEPFEKLVDPQAQVAFDLDGSGMRRHWGWTTPKAAWLVFDGKQTGEITSGLQLFGNVTFWIFWRDGYQALGSLDANGDGVLEGAELSGLALWVDANGNGVSEPGEVKPLADYGIVRVSCQGTDKAVGLRWSPQGVRFQDGRTRPSYDWDAPMNAPAASQ